jgi:hypothetical protein
MPTSFEDLADDVQSAPCCRRRGRAGMYMGPCADMLGINVMVAFWICIAQLPVTLTLALHLPTIRLDIYSTAIRTVLDPSTNRTVIAASDQTSVVVPWYNHAVGISGLFVLNSSLIAIFGTMTMSFCERGIAASAAARARRQDCEDDRDEGFVVGTNVMQEEEYVAQNIGMSADPAFRSWNQAFCAMVLCLHTTVTAAICSPVCADALAIYILLTVLSLLSVLQPLDNFESNACREYMENAPSGSTGGSGSGWIMASVSAQSTMVRVGLFAASVAFAMQRIPLDPFSCRAQVALALACIDGFLLMGHLWDKVPNLQVIANCRLLYACMAAFFNAGVLLAWSYCGAEISFMQR